MRRETSNRIRFVIEDLLPPFFRDGALFRLIGRAASANYIDATADFRKRAPFLTEAEYDAFYRASPRVHEETDNSKACLERIAEEIVGVSLCDAGCGTGYLLRYLRDRVPGKRMVGAELVIAQHPDNYGIEFHEAKVERLPFRDREFDTVLCTHVLEHILDLRAAIAELRRITAKRLIIVVPMEREALYAFNLHLNFFPYPHSFLRAMIPVPPRHVCVPIGRDLYYREDVD